MAEKDFRVRKGLVVDGTSSATSVAVTTGNVVIAAGTLGLTDGLLIETVAGTPNVSKISSQPTNGNIEIAPNGTGDIVLDTDNLDVSADEMKISIKDNVSAALDITEGSNSYLKFVTTDNSEQIVFGKNSTFASTTIADLGSVTTVDINGGTIDGATIATSDITVGTGKTLDVSAGTLTLADDQISGDKVSGGTIGTTTITALAGDLSLGDNDITNVGDIALDSISADGNDINITLTDNRSGALSFKEGSNVYLTLNTADSGGELIDLGKNLRFLPSTESVRKISIEPVSGTNSTGRDLHFEAGTSTGNEVGGEIVFKVGGAAGSSGSTATTLTTALTLTGAGVATIPNVDINGGAIDGAAIGVNAQSTAKITTLETTSHARINGSARETNTLLQVNGDFVASGGNLGGGGSAASANTNKYAEVRIHSDIANDDLAGMHVENMGGVYIIDNAENAPNTGQGSIYTVGRSGTGDAWGAGRQATTGKYAIGYINKDYDNTADSADNPMRTAQSTLEIDTSGNTTLTKNGAYLAFTGATSGAAAREIRFRASTNGITASGNETYILPVSFPPGDRVLQSNSTGGLSWVAQSGGTSVSGTDNRMVRMDGTTGLQDTGITVDDSDNISGVGTLSATTITSSLGFVSTKDTDGEFIALTLTNESDAADTSGIVSQLFNLEDTSGNAVDSGKIAVKKEASFTSTATTQDSSMVFSTSLNGTLTEQVAIDSDGQVGIGTTTPSYTLDVTAPSATVPTIRVKSTNSGTGPKMRFVHDDGGTPSNGDQIATLGFFGESADDSQIEYARIGVKASAVAAGSEGGRIEFYVPKTGNGAMSNLDPHMSIISGATVLTSTVDIACNLVVDGDLTVSGDTITANVGTLDVEDKNITLNKSSGDSSSTADGAGITIQDAVDASTDASLLWTASTDRFGFSHGLDVTGSLTADTSLTLDAVTITTAEIEVLDGVTAGAVTASRALVVDADKDLNDSSNHLRDVRMRNLTSTGTLTSTQFSSDYGDIKTVQVASGTINDGAAVTIAQIDSTAYRGAEVLTTVYNDTDNTTDLFKTVIMWDGHDTTLNDSAAACHYTNYAVLSSGDVAKGDISAVKNSANIDVKFTSSSGSNDTYVIRAQLILLDI